MNRSENSPVATAKPAPTRRMGAQVQTGGVAFRAWAPQARRVAVVLETDGVRECELTPERDGFFSGDISGAGAGDRYRFRIDGGPLSPDPASRFQPDGPHGASEVIDPSKFAWSDAGWPGI